MPNKWKRCWRKSKSRENQLKQYRNENRQMSNKAIKLKRHLKKHPNEKQWWETLKTMT